MRRTFLSGAAALAVAAGAILGTGGPTSASMYYPWAGQFPWDQPGRVNADVISDQVLSSSTHWPALTGYGFYRPTYFYACRHTRCRHGEQHW